jgi:DNA gyrase subunit A
VTENGFGKRSPISQYRIQRRGGAGLKTAKLNNKTGHLAAVQILTNEQEYLIIISQKSQVIKTRLNTVRLASRATQGVKLINLRNGDKVASVICV